MRGESDTSSEMGGEEGRPPSRRMALLVRARVLCSALPIRRSHGPHTVSAAASFRQRRRAPSAAVSPSSPTPCCSCRSSSWPHWPRCCCCGGGPGCPGAWGSAVLSTCWELPPSRLTPRLSVPLCASRVSTSRVSSTPTALQSLHFDYLAASPTAVASFLHRRHLVNGQLAPGAPPGARAVAPGQVFDLTLTLVRAPSCCCTSVAARSDSHSLHSPRRSCPSAR